MDRQPGRPRLRLELRVRLPLPTSPHPILTAALVEASRRAAAATTPHAIHAVALHNALSSARLRPVRRLRAIAEFYACDDGGFVGDFVAAWDKVMNLDRF